jgi:hypothetical protein
MYTHNSNPNSDYASLFSYGEIYYIRATISLKTTMKVEFKSEQNCFMALERNKVNHNSRGQYIQERR